MTDLRLSDAVDAAEALLQPVRVPGQVVVHHQMRAALKVHTFAGRIVGDHHADDGITVEGRDGSATSLARDAAMDNHHGRGVAKARRDLVREIFERVLRLGEDENLAP